VAPHLTDDQIARLRELAEQQAKEPNPAARARLVHTFYATLFEGLQRPRLRALMDKLECEVRRYLLALPDRHFIGYSDVVEALAQRDAELAAERMTRHLERVCEEAVRRLRQLLAEGGQVATPPSSARTGRRRKAAG
jgi:DNA-binding GntR family transcriptional regulator